MLLSDIPESSTPTTPLVAINPFDTPNERIHNPTDLDSPRPAAAFGYAGPEWRGGGGRVDNLDQPSTPPLTNRTRRALPDKWWRAVWAWGADLDGGHDDEQDGGQAGRTNPFE